MRCLFLLPLCAVFGANFYRNAPDLSAFIGGTCRCPDGEAYVASILNFGSYCGPIACEGGVVDDYCHIINNVTGCAAGRRVTCDGCVWTVANNTDITDATTSIEYGPANAVEIAQSTCAYYGKTGRCKAVVCDDATGICNLKNAVTQVAAPGKTAYIPNAACYQRKTPSDISEAVCRQRSMEIPTSYYTRFVKDVQFNGTATTNGTSSNFTIAKVNQSIPVKVFWDFDRSQTNCPGCQVQSFVGSYRDQIFPAQCYDMNINGFQFNQSATLSFSDWGCHFVGVYIDLQNSCVTLRPTMGEPVAVIYIQGPTDAPTTAAPTTGAPTAPTQPTPAPPSAALTSGAQAMSLAVPSLIVSALL